METLKPLMHQECNKETRMACLKSVFAYAQYAVYDHEKQKDMCSEQTLSILLHQMDDLDPAIISQLSDIFICYSMYNSLPQYINEITLHIVTIAKSCPISALQSLVYILQSFLSVVKTDEYLSFLIQKAKVPHEKAISPIVQCVFLATYSDLQMEELEAICARLKTLLSKSYSSDVVNAFIHKLTQQSNERKNRNSARYSFPSSKRDLYSSGKRLSSPYNSIHHSSPSNPTATETAAELITPPPASSVASPVPLSIPITPTTTYVLNRRHSRNSLGFSSSQSSTKERNSSEDLHMSTPEEVHSSDKRNSASRSTYHAYEHSRPKSEDRTHRHSFSSLSGITSSSSKKQSTIDDFQHYSSYKEYKLNQLVRVTIKKQQLMGYIQYIGSIPNRESIYFGIELTEDSPIGGIASIDGVLFFNCSPHRGVFVKYSSIAPLV